MMRVCVACLLTFAAQQSISQMHMQTIKVMYGGCVYVASFLKDLLHTRGHLLSLMVGHFSLIVCVSAHWHTELQRNTISSL